MMAEPSQTEPELLPLSKDSSFSRMSQGESPIGEHDRVDGQEISEMTTKGKLDREPKSSINPSDYPSGSSTVKHKRIDGREMPKRTEKRQRDIKPRPSIDSPDGLSRSKETEHHPALRKDNTSSKEKEQTDGTRNLTPFFIIGIALLVGIYFYYRESPATTPPFSLYEQELEKMHAKYTNQTDRFWTTFLSSFDEILNSADPDLPAVIMMAVPDGHQSMGLCFLQHVAEVVNKVLGGMNPPSLVDGSKLSSLGADEQKVKIDDEIKKIVKSNQRTVIVNGLEKLDPQAILLFHGYCDNSEAVFKNIAILFMLRIPEESNYSTDEEVYAFLFKLWTVLGPAKTKALLARMANNVAIMQKSSHFIC